MEKVPASIHLKIKKDQGLSKFLSLWIHQPRFLTKIMPQQQFLGKN